MSNEIPFDDIDALNAAAGDDFGDWGPEIEVTQDMIQGFADLTGDHQWIHVDVERAKDGPFGTTIAHGFMTLSLLPKLNPGGLKLAGVGNAVNYGSDGFRFLAPVPSGSRLRARNRVVGAEARKNGTLLTSEIAVHVVGNDTPSLLYKMLILYQGKR